MMCAACAKCSKRRALLFCVDVCGIRVTFFIFSYSVHTHLCACLPPPSPTHTHTYARVCACDARYGVLPSPELPNTFLAQAFDLDDPWGPGAGPCQSDKVGPDGWACCDYSWGLAGKCAYNKTKCAGREKICEAACASTEVRFVLHVTQAL